MNRGIDAIFIDSVRFLVGDPFLSLIDSAGLADLTVPPGGRGEIRVGFCPGAVSCVEGRIGVYVRSPSGGDPIFHAVGVGGCGGAPFIEVKEDRLEFGGVLVSQCRQESFTLRNAGNYPLRIFSLAPANPAFRVVDPSAFPFTLPPYGSRTVVVEFCPLGEGAVLDSLQVVSDADNPAPSLHLAARGDVRRLLLPVIFDVGTVLLGNCRDTFVVVRNGGTLPVTVTAAVLADLSLPVGFSITSQFPAGWSRTLPPQDTLQIHLRFCPPTAGGGTDTLRITDENEEAYRVVLRGKGISPMLWLDTVAAEAGEIATLTFKIGPEDAVGPGPYKVRFSFNPDALSPVAVAPATAGGSVVIDRLGRGNLQVKGDRSDPLPADGSLFTISFRGLSSGRPVNIVEIEEAEFPVPISKWDTLDGMVLLSGCDVGRTPGGAKRAHISRLGPNPAAESVSLSYLAPQGRQPVLTIFDFRGERVQTVELPEGTGEMQEYRLDLADFPRGLYTMELRERNERSWRLLLID